MHVCKDDKYSAGHTTKQNPPTDLDLNKRITANDIEHELKKKSKDNIVTCFEVSRSK